MERTRGWARRAVLRAGAGLIAASVGVPAQAAEVVPTEDEPHHHLIFQNAILRVMRVMIRPGDATAWHLHRFDYGTAILSGTTTREEVQGSADAPTQEVATGSVHFAAYHAHSAIRRVSNVGQTLYHQVAFQLLRPEAGHFGRADRTGVPAFTSVLDQPLVRAWRLKLEPGDATAPYRQDGPGLRVILTGDRLIDTKPGEIGHESDVRPGQAVFMLPASRSITNSGAGPLEMVEFELL